MNTCSQLKKILVVLAFASSILALIIPLGALTFVAAQPWWDNNWQYREQITITNVGSTVLTDFPGYLKVPYRSGMQADYEDIRFISQDGTTILDYEIEYYDASHAEVWVRIPSLNLPSTTVWLYYGNNSATSAENPAGVWINNYISVWHFKEGTGTNLSDSTGNFPAILTGSANWNNSNNVVGPYYNFNGSEQAATIASFTGGTVGTIEFWFRPENLADNTQRIIGINDGWELRFNWTGSGNNTPQRISYDIQRTGSNENIVTSTLFAQSQWAHVAFTWNSGTPNWVSYVNGVADNSGPPGAFNTNAPQSDILTIANRTGQASGQRFIGALDELRISSVQRSPDWIKQTFAMVNNANSVVIGGYGIRPKSLPINNILGILQKNECKNHPEREGCSQ
ncbi:MAG: hypothetical protein APG12_01606 [Candidatus Methanofastidiosum methylothiophilum]|uniref:DUF2341 domain-containing protein n=1 Tax=Candidatus Methanofastidiosum methylothiophilum TaxID=1705564 RepID=A0A150IX28_9EURY|nr:MAG: hypothetical protein APG10_01517 [Candidatus Methanofastidiosum methylthiophilus]KYC46763.1 MAG: hypothetical protein APG11_01703 [Candidatus Methanofastidiosum methylthiophilus]KYC49224.1 MAG: hypothetical protein APG12_01606 [Candidatus Methanofastidiosum methylthiophilus]